ncbi:MAG: hypothetical protein GEU91_14030 [Rhizobiales bacterium]|nr:hypothetical protein [Hyphomicrobiales bacterium]
MSAPLPVSVAMIVECVAAAFDVAPRDIRSDRRRTADGGARNAVYWVARELTGSTFALIGRALGRDHSTALHGAERAAARRARDPDYAAKLDAIVVAVQAIGRSNLAHALADADAVAAAGRIAADPLREATRVSTLETAAMAARLIDLEDVAGATFQLLCHLDDLQANAGAAERTAALRASARALITSIASALEALGYATEENNDGPDQYQQDQDAGLGLAGAAE